MLRFKFILMFLGALVIAQFGAGRLYAQDDIRDKIEKVKLEKMVKKMDLDESTAASFKDRYKLFSKTLRELNQKRAKTYLLMTQNIEGGSGLDSLVDQLIAIESDIYQQRLSFVSDLKAMLSAKQLAIMIVFERKFNTELKKLLKEYRKENGN
jgi:Flp pilus assembly protein TadB